MVKADELECKENLSYFKIALKIERINLLYCDYELKIKKVSKLLRCVDSRGYWIILWHIKWWG